MASFQRRGYAPSLSHSLFSSSSLEMVPSARHAARLERFAIRGDVPSDASTDMTASPAFVKNTLSALFCGPYPCWIIARTAVSPAVRTLWCMQRFYHSLGICTASGARFVVSENGIYQQLDGTRIARVTGTRSLQELIPDFLGNCVVSAFGAGCFRFEPVEKLLMHNASHVI